MLAEEKTIEKEVSVSIMKDIATLMKLRLSFLVVISAVACFFFMGGGLDIRLFYLIAGGFLITGASNGFNQIIEKDLDKLMPRTMNRPLAQGRMSVSVALIISITSGIAGAVLLFQLNFFSGILGILAMVLYAAIYTPMKKISPWAVFVGAFPGAIPPMIGVVAHTGTFELIAGTMFLVQFFWQFPHFWAIAWVMDDDYAKAGFSLLPMKSRKSKQSAFLIVLYTAFMVPVGVLPWAWGWTNDWSLYIGTIAGLWFFAVAYRFYLSLDDKHARNLMFASFLYLPLIQFLYVFTKI
jgi:heme o synthase